MGENVIFCNWSKMLEEIGMVPTALCRNRSGSSRTI